MSVDESATPSRHHSSWWDGPIRLLYAGFDGLDVAFQGRLSNHMLGVLADARSEAEALGAAVAREVDGLRFRLLPRGAPEGFRYLIETGDDGEIWKIKHNADTRQWNLFVSVRAFALLTHGYIGVRRRLEERMNALEATVAAERVHRADLACDLDVPSFEPEPDCFVAPARTRARSYHPGDGAREADRVEVHRLARRVNGVTVGRMPGRQLCLYDKRADSLLKRKLYWADVWRLDLAEHREPIWRSEIRAGRDELARHLRVRSFAALEAALPKIVASIFEKVRYVAPSCFDSNPSRWPTHPIWQAAETHIRDAIAAHAFASCPPRNELTTPRLIKLDDLRRQLVGLAATCGALEGLPDHCAGDLPGLVAAVIRDYARDRPGLLEEKLARARARYGVVG